MSRAWRRNRRRIFEDARRTPGQPLVPEPTRPGRPAPAPRVAEPGRVVEVTQAVQPGPVVEVTQAAQPGPVVEVTQAVQPGPVVEVTQAAQLGPVVVAPEVERPGPVVVAPPPTAPSRSHAPEQAVLFAEDADASAFWLEPEPEEAVAGATRRPEPRRRTRRSRPRRPGPDLVGSDFLQKPARRAARRRPGLLAPVATGLLGALLLLAALHLDLLRLGYAQGQALREETRLLQELADLVVEERGHHDPAELRRRAEEMGLGVAERVIELPLRVASREEAP